MTYKIYSIVYKEDQIAEHTKYDNSHIRTVEDKSYLFEYNPIVDIVSNHEITEDYLGIFSWKLPLKTGLFKKKLLWLLKNAEQADGYSACVHKFPGGYLKFTEKYHPGFMELFKPLCEDLGLSSKEPEHMIYSNYFFLKTELYKDYVETVIKPAIELLETKYKDLAWRDANYTDGLQGDTLKYFTGLDYYTFHTFIIERLIGQYIDTKGLNFKKII